MRDDLKKIVKKKNLKIDQILENKKLRRAFFNGRTLMFGFIKSDMSFYKVSDSMAECMGYTPEELEGKNIFDFSVLEQLEKDAYLYEYMIKTKKNSFFLHTAKYYKKGGEEIQVQCLEPVYFPEDDLWLINSYEIDKDSEGITVLTDNFQKYLNGRD